MRGQFCRLRFAGAFIFDYDEHITVNDSGIVSTPFQTVGDSLNIDRSFVMGTSISESNKVIVKAIIAMGHSLGIKIIAEGIETEQQFRLLQEFGADEGQGFYFSPPVPEDEFISLIEKGTL